MDQYDELIKTIEGEDLTREVLKYSKLRKGESTGHVELLWQYFSADISHGGNGQD